MYTALSTGTYRLALTTGDLWGSQILDSKTARTGASET